LAEDDERLGDAGLSAGAKAIGIGAADHAGLGAERARTTRPWRNRAIQPDL